VHFEVRWGKNSFQQTYNPELWMAPPEGWGVLVGRITGSPNETLDPVDVYVKNTATGKTHLVRTYGGDPVNSDPYYNENLAIGDLPAGLYKVTFEYKEKDQQAWMDVYPGRITYFSFRGPSGFELGGPSSDQAEPPTPAAAP
jgi:hypothetical protein